MSSLLKMLVKSRFEMLGFEEEMMRRRSDGGVKLRCYFDQSVTSVWRDYGEKLISFECKFCLN